MFRSVIRKLKVGLVFPEFSTSIAFTPSADEVDRIQDLLTQKKEKERDKRKTQKGGLPQDPAVLTGKRKSPTRKIDDVVAVQVIKGLGPLLVQEITAKTKTPGKKGATISAIGSLPIPRQLLRVLPTVPIHNYLIDTSVAKEVVDKVLKFDPTLNPSSPIIEFGPGFGLLTSELLAAGFKNVTIFEEFQKFSEFLVKRFDTDKVTVVEKGLSELPRLHHVDKLDGGHRISSLLQQVKVDRSLPPEPLRIFGFLPHKSHLHFLLRTLAAGRVFFEEDPSTYHWLEPKFYVGVGAKTFWCLNSSPQCGYFLYRPTSVIYQLFFHQEVLGTLPRSAFIPWAKESSEGKSRKFALRNIYNHSVVHLVRLQTREDVISRVGRERLIHLFYFIRQHLFARSNKVIAELEKWVPGCGVKLIRKGFTIYTEFGELKPTEVLELFLEFSSWPEYESSSFLTAVEKFQARLLDLQEEQDQ